jgi:hypothetical protein
LQPGGGNAPTGGTVSSFWGGDGFTFADILDIVNPLQHIPGISHLYRDATGDTTSSAASIVGGGLFGGVVGLVGSTIDALVQGVTGKGISDRVYDALALTGADKEKPQTVPLWALPRSQAALEGDPESYGHLRGHQAAKAYGDHYLMKQALQMPGKHLNLVQ